jgi:hypothetical protein
MGNEVQKCFHCRSVKGRQCSILPKKIVSPFPDASISLCNKCEHKHYSGLVDICRRSLKMAVPRYRDLEARVKASQSALIAPSNKRHKRVLNKLGVVDPAQEVQNFNAMHTWQNIATEYTSWGLIWLFLRHFEIECEEPPALSLDMPPMERCCVCSTGANVTKHHVIPRSFLAVMDAPTILAPLCLECHKNYERKASGLKKLILGGLSEHPLVQARGMAWAYLDGRITDPTTKFEIRCYLFDLIEGGEVHIPQEEFFRLSRNDLMSLAAQTDLFGEKLMRLMCDKVPTGIIVNSWLAHFAKHCLGVDK